VADKKWCNSASHYVDRGDFYKNGSSPDGLDYYCKCCRKSRKRVRKEKEAEYHKKYRVENKEARRLQSQRFRVNNKGYFSSWRLANLDKARSYVQRYKTKKRNATPPWLTEFHYNQIQDIYAHARDCELVSGTKYHVDHIIPIQGENVCGLHVPWNLQVLPADINISKSNRVY